MCLGCLFLFFQAAEIKCEDSRHNWIHTLATCYVRQLNSKCILLYRYLILKILKVFLMLKKFFNRNTKKCTYCWFKILRNFLITFLNNESFVLSFSSKIFIIWLKFYYSTLNWHVLMLTECSCMKIAYRKVSLCLYPLHIMFKIQTSLSFNQVI